MGLRFSNEVVLSITQVGPMTDTKKTTSPVLTPLQDALMRRLGEGSYPFSLDISSHAPPSVQLVPAKKYYGAPIGTSYDIRCYVGKFEKKKI